MDIQWTAILLFLRGPGFWATHLCPFDAISGGTPPFCAKVRCGKWSLHQPWRLIPPNMGVVPENDEQIMWMEWGFMVPDLQTKPYVMNQLWWETESTAFDEDLVHGYLCVPQISHFDRILSVFLETRDNPGFPAERTHGLAKGNQFCFNFMSIKGEWLGGLDRFATQFFFGVVPYHSILSHAILSWVLSHIYIFSSPISCWETSSILAARRLYQLGKQPFQATTSLGSLVSEVWNGLVMG
jgi:hypothetical protein